MEMPGVLLKCFLTKNISTCANKRIPRKALKRKFFLSSGKNINKKPGDGMAVNKRKVNEKISC